jgi:hypothetical protein
MLGAERMNETFKSYLLTSELRKLWLPGWEAEELALLVNSSVVSKSLAWVYVILCTQWRVTTKTVASPIPKNTYN